VARGRNRRRVDRERPAPPPSALRQGLKLAGLWSAGIVGASAVLALGLRELSSGDLLRIRSIRVKGLARASEAEVLSLSPVKVGDELFSSAVDAVASAVERHPWIARATVYRRLPPALEVRVVEREPRAIVELGSLYLVDRDGAIFKRAAPGDGLDLPLVTGFSRKEFEQHNPLFARRMGAVLAVLDAYGREGLGPLAPVSEIHVDGEEGVVLYVGDEGTQVLLGQGESQEIPDRLRRLHQVLLALRAEGRKAEVIHLEDRSHPDRVAVRPAGRGGEKEGAGVVPAPARAEGAREGPGRRRGRDAPLARR